MFSLSDDSEIYITYLGLSEPLGVRIRIIIKNKSDDTLKFALMPSSDPDFPGIHCAPREYVNEDSNPENGPVSIVPQSCKPAQYNCILANPFSVREINHQTKLCHDGYLGLQGHLQERSAMFIEPRYMGGWPEHSNDNAPSIEAILFRIMTKNARFTTMTSGNMANNIYNIPANPYFHSCVAENCLDRCYCSYGCHP